MAVLAFFRYGFAIEGFQAIFSAFGDDAIDDGFDDYVLLVHYFNYNFLLGDKIVIIIIR
jgi:hypothetical protein